MPKLNYDRVLNEFANTKLLKVSTSDTISLLSIDLDIDTDQNSAGVDRLVSDLL